MRGLKGLGLAALVLLLAAGCGSGGTEGRSDRSSDKTKPVVTVYTARHYAADSQVFEAFTKMTGIAVREVKGTAEELVARMLEDGGESEADLLITVDGGALNHAKASGVLQPMQSAAVQRQVPARWRDPESYWTGIATRARVIVYAKDRIRPDELSTYEDLTADKWKGRLLVRSSSSLYNQSLLASLIELHGEQQAERWAQGIARNLARPPEGGDRAQAQAIYARQGDLAIMNTYYIGQMSASKDPEEVKIADSLGVFFPNQQTSGTHINISGAGLSKHAPNKPGAIRLVEFMTGPEGQTLLAQGSFEYPVNREAETPELLKSWGEFVAQTVDYSRMGEQYGKAADIFGRVGWK